MRTSRRRMLLWIERSLVAFGVGSAVWLGLSAWMADSFQREQRLALEAVHVAEGTAPPARLDVGDAVGDLEFPRLGRSAIVAEGDDKATLGVAVGHLPDTPLPWQGGNTAFAGHRDTFFRPLRHLRPGDEIHLATAYGDYRYEVRETLVVRPEDVWVLDPTGRPTLTLITCYPFDYIGAAPSRFIVRAALVSGEIREGAPLLAEAPRLPVLEP